MSRLKAGANSKSGLPLNSVNQVSQSFLIKSDQVKIWKQFGQTEPAAPAIICTPFCSVMGLLVDLPNDCTPLAGEQRKSYSKVHRMYLN